METSPYSASASSYDEVSYGVIPIAYENPGKIYVCMVQHKAGKHWAFPKGHMEPNELPLETAARELQEETGLQVYSWLPCDPIEESYTLLRNGENKRKRVVYFYGYVGQGNALPKISLCPKEVESGRFFLLAEIEDRATFPEMKRLAKKVSQDISQMKLFSL